VKLNGIQFRLKARAVAAVPVCLSLGKEQCVKDLLQRVEALLPGNMYFVIFDDCGKIPPMPLLVSATAYTVRGILENKTISRKPALDFLLYLQGDRNIHLAIQRFSSGCGRRLGAVFIAVETDVNSLEREVDKIVSALGAYKEDYSEEESLEFYSKIAGTPKEKTVTYLRAKMALEALEV
jgi:tRNA threonylcarbamoyladenosine modification (KEOPS) complex Cgi121 subunit